MIRQAARWLIFILAAVLFSLGGMAPLAMMIFPVPVAAFRACDRFGAALGAMAVAGLTVTVGTGYPQMGLAAMLIAGVGWLVGIHLKKERSFGHCVATLALGQYLFLALEAAVFWQGTREAWRQYWDQQAEQVRQAGGESAEPFLGFIHWVQEHWAYLGFGVVFAGVLVIAVMQSCTIYRWLRQAPPEAGAPPLHGQFKTMRPSEWLVWLAIAAGVLGLADYQWPNEVMRLISWNLGIAVYALYWLNGLGIAICALEAFGASPFVVILGLGLLMLSNMQVVLSGFGLFDTWYEYRLMFARLGAAWRRRSKEEPPDE